MEKCESDRDLLFDRHCAFCALSKVCACGGGTIPLLQQWLWDGMSMGSAAAFMLTGPSTKITNLGALKIVLGIRRFLLYLLFVMIFAFLTGIVVNLLIPG